ncbi:MAG: 2-keto-3-deoxygluconate permease [Treponema phagedenis]|nr:2-keto-3-deoxygluconate permease [Treponema phagedenis]
MATTIDWNPIISTLIPMGIGILIGNVDKEFAKFLGSIVGVLMVFMGWSFGAGINLIDAFKAGFQGIILTVVFYILVLPLIYLVETKLLKESGISSIAMTSIAGLSVAVPSIIALSYPELAPMAETAVAQIALGVVISSAITPFIAKYIADKKEIIKQGV